MGQLTQSELGRAKKLTLENISAKDSGIGGWVCVWCWKREDEKFKCIRCNYDNSVHEILQLG